MSDMNDQKPIENMGESSPLPEFEQAEVSHYAYDPQTYEILCRPGQRLSERKAQRLRELNLYAHVVKLADSQSPETPIPPGE